MELRAGYKQTEVGVIPLDWEVKPLPSVLDFIGGKAHEQHISPYGDFIVVNSKFISSDGEVAKYSAVNFCPARQGDILMVMSDLPNGKALAKCFLVEEDRRYAVNQRVCILRPRKADSIFFLYQLSRNPYFLAFDDGVQQTHLLNGVFRACPVVVPPTIKEQRAIAAALSDADALIASLDALIAKKRDLKRAAMQRLLTGKTRLPGFTGVWEVKRLGEVAAIRNHKINTLDTEAAAFCVELEQVGQNTGQIEGHSDARTRRSVKYLFQKGDVLFGRLRPYLRKFWWATREGVCSTEIWPLIPIGSRLVSGFLFQTIQTDAFIEAANSSYGTHMPRSDWNALTKFELRLPVDPAEQTAIAGVLFDMDVELTALEAKRNKARGLKQGMMQELLTGRIRLI